MLVEEPELLEVEEKLVLKDVEEPLVRIEETLVEKEVEEPPMQVKQGATPICTQF